MSNAPFLYASSFDREVEEAPPTPPPPTAAPWSPFVAVYEGADQESYDEPAREAYATLVNALYDEEFEESLYELLTDARNLHQDHLANGHSSADADRVVTQHFTQLARESEAALDSLARELGDRKDALVADEIESFFERYTAATPLDPPFQNWLGGLVKKVAKGVRSVAGKVATGIATLGLGPVLNRLKALIRPLLNRVLQAAIGRLPEAVRPAARMLAQRLGFPVPAPAAPVAAAEPAAPAIPPAPGNSAAPTESSALPAAAAGEPPPADAAAPPPPEATGSPVQASAAPSVSEMQLEFDELLAEAMLADDTPQMELEMARARAAASEVGRPVFTDLDQARERFVQQLESLREGESPAPYVENFLPALLPAIRIAVRLAGRPNVVSFLAGPIASLISKLIGPANAPALSRAIADAGLRLMSLEAPGDEARLATSAVAATVEETVARVASLPDEVLDNEELLEGFVLEAFEQAAAANLPALFSEATYRRRPELLEGGVNAAWLMLPIRRPRYKRCSRTFPLTLTPYMAEAIQSFEDTPLADHLQDQLGIPEGEDVEAEVHLYEVLPGGTAADIARGERETPGLGATDEAALSQLHPLTHEAAGVLFGRPALGRRLPPGVTIRSVYPGQRLYKFVIRGRLPLSAPGIVPYGRRWVRRLPRVHVVLDFPRDQIRVCVFLSEAKAQRLAVRLRQQAHVGALTASFHRLLRIRLPNILLGRRGRRLRIVHPSVPPGPPSAAVLQRLPGIVPQTFIGTLQGWLVQGFADFVKGSAQQIIAAAQDPADGVTLVFTIDQPAGLKALGDALAGGRTAAPAGETSPTPPSTPPGVPAAMSNAAPALTATAPTLPPTTAAAPPVPPPTAPPLGAPPAPAVTGDTPPIRVEVRPGHRCD